MLLFGSNKKLCLLTFIAFIMQLHIPLVAAPKSDYATLAAIFSEQKMMQSNGSPIRLAREDWDEAQRLVVNDARWKQWLTERQLSVDEWMIRFYDRPEWISGWQHELVDPITQAPVKWTRNMPEPKDGQGSQLKFKQAWVSWTRSYNFEMTLEAARLYRLTGNQRYADWSAKQIDFYAQNYSKWPLRTWNGKAKMMGQSLDEATGSIQLIEAVRLLGNRVASKRTTQWRDNLFFPIAANLADFNQGVNNIALWHSVAITLISWQFGDDKRAELALNGSRGFRNLIDTGITDDYIWYEGSFAYNDYALRALTPLFIQASLLKKSGLIQREMLLAQNMLLATSQFRFADGNLPSPNDGNSRIKAIDLGLYASLYRVFPTQAGITEAKRRNNWDTLVDPISLAKDGVQPPPKVFTKNFEAIRMAMLKSDYWQAFVHYGQVVQHHAQQEATSYELYGNGSPLSVDQGTVSYGSEFHENYFRKAIAHNVPLINGEGQKDWALGIVEHFDAKTNTLAVSQPNYTTDSSVKRTYKIVDNEFIDHIAIKLKPPNSRHQRIGMLFHSECPIEAKSTVLGLPIQSHLPVTKGFSYWKSIFAYRPPPNWSVTLNCPNERYTLSVSGPIIHTVHLASVPATPLLARRHALYLETLGNAASYEFRFIPNVSSQLSQ
jgi:hypothetical protein